MAEAEETLLNYKVDFNPKSAIAASKTFEKSLNKDLKRIEKQEAKLNKGILKFMTQRRNATKLVDGSTKKEVNAQKQIGKAMLATIKTIRASTKEVEEHEEAIRNLQEQEDKLAASGATYDSAERKNVRATSDAKKKDLVAAKREQELLERGLRTQLAARKTVRDRAKEHKETLRDKAPDDKDFIESFKAGGENLVAPLRELLSAKEQWAAIFERGASTASAILGDGLLWDAAAAGEKFGEKAKELLERSEAAKARYKEQGVGKGKGTALAMAGGAAKGISSALGMLSKLGPIIQAASGFMMGLVKLFLDAEAAAKEYNKTVLATSGTSEFLAGSMGDSSAAAKELESTLSDLRDGGMAWSMVQWGISKEVSSSFQSALTAEGVSLKRLGRELDSATGYAQSHAQVIQMSVGYSRAMGISLSEISQLQGQLMTEIGMGLDGVEASFQNIVRGAAESGMATNKFFGIISAFSTDLTLFTLRMEEITKVMGALGKVMSPRDAQKFMQNLSGKFGGGLQDNLKHTAIGGAGAVRAVAKEDVANKLKGLSQDIVNATGSSAKGIMDIIADTNDPDRAMKIAQWQADQGEKINGALMSSILDAAQMQEKLGENNAVDTAAILDQLSPLGKMEVAQRESMRMFNGKRLEQLSGNQLLAVESTGIATVAELRGFKKLQAGVLASQQGMLKRISAGQQTSEDIASASNLGVKLNEGTAAENAKTLQGIFTADKSNQKFWGSLDRSQTDLLTASAKEMDYQEETSTFQTSSLDQLGIIADILTNEIYGMMTKIRDLMWKLVPKALGGPDEEKKRFERFASSVPKDANSRAAVEGSKGNIFDAQKALIETSGKQMIRDSKAAAKKSIELQKQFKLTKNPKEKADLQAEIDLLDKASKTRGTALKAMYDRTPEGLVIYLAAYKKLLQDAGMLGAGGAAAPATAAPAAYLFDPAAAAPAAAPAAAVPAAKAAAKAAVAAAPAAAPAAPATSPAKVAEVAKEGVKQQEATVAGVAEVHSQLKTGVKLDKSQLSGPFADAMEKSVYKGASRALFEYYMLSAITDRSQVVAAVNAGATPSGLMGEMGKGTQTPEQVIGAATAHAGGGMVTSIANGVANVSKLPPGEGWTSIGAGEKILPAGGRGGGGGGGVKVELELKGDLRKFINARVVEGAAQFEKNKRFR